MKQIRVSLSSAIVLHWNHDTSSQTQCTKTGEFMTKQCRGIFETLENEINNKKNHMSGVRCHMSHVTWHMLHVTNANSPSQ